MDSAVFRKFCQLIYDKSGITLRDGKESMVSARIAKRMRALGLADHEAYLHHVKADSTGDEVVQLLDAVSTNVTKFYREAEHFDFLRECMEAWLKAGQRRFRLWSAASSSGEEPYTIAITIAEACRGFEVDAKLLATDISTRVLERAKAGVYDGDKVEPVPPHLRERHFEKVRTEDGKPAWRVSEALRRLVVFKRLNLAEPPFPMQGPLDIVFIRNVMIYFDNEVRGRLLEEAWRLLKTGGYLLVGHAESLTGMMSRFKTVRPSIYVKG